MTPGALMVLDGNGKSTPSNLAKKITYIGSDQANEGRNWKHASRHLQHRYTSQGSDKRVI